ncbi:MAG: hypothetical protein ACLT0Y_05150 [Christensenellales bacterium]
MSPRFLDYKKAILSAISAVNLLAMVFCLHGFIFICIKLVLRFIIAMETTVLFHLRHFLYAITSVLGGYRIGRLRCSEIIYSNFLSLALANVFTFFIMALIARFWLPAGPILIMTLVEYAVVVIWSLFSSRLYHSVYPPRRMLLVSGSNTSEHLIDKMNKRPDKYEIRECIDADTEIHLLRQKIDEYDAIVICDVGAQMQEL